MCGLTSQVLAKDFKAGGHPDLISAAKLLQRFLAFDFIVVYCRLLSFIVVYFEVLRLYVIDAPCVMAEELFFARRTTFARLSAIWRRSEGCARAG